MAGSQVPTSITILNSLKGFQALSMTEYTTSAAAAIAAGSIVEIAGAFFQFAADETPTGWSSIATGSTAYIALTASGTAGSQIVEASYTATAPTWRDDHQGWYASAASSVRIVASVYKAEAARYMKKYVYEGIRYFTQPEQNHGKQYFYSSGTFITSTSTIWVTACGGGAAGSSRSGNIGGSGGRAGAYVYKVPYSVGSNETITITIGTASNTTVISSSISLSLSAGAAIGASGYGGSGLSTSGTAYAGSGYGGDSGSSNTDCGGGGGGAQSPGIFATLGSLATNGSSGHVAGGSAGWGGGGGGGSGLVVVTVAGGNGGAGKYGGGGGGGGGGPSGGSGGAGSSGVVLIEW